MKKRIATLCLAMTAGLSLAVTAADDQTAETIQMPAWKH